MATKRLYDPNAWEQRFDEALSGQNQPEEQSVAVQQPEAKNPAETRTFTDVTKTNEQSDGNTTSQTTWGTFKPEAYEEQMSQLNKLREQKIADKNAAQEKNEEYKKKAKRYALIAGLTDVGSALTNLYFTAGGLGKDKNGNGLTEAAPAMQPTNLQQNAGNYIQRVEALKNAGDAAAQKRLAEVEKAKASLGEKYMELANKRYKTGETKTETKNREQIATKNSQSEWEKLQQRERDSKRSTALGYARINAEKLAVPFTSSRGMPEIATFKNEKEYNAATRAIAVELMSNPKTKAEAKAFIKEIYANEIAELIKTNNITGDEAYQKIVSLKQDEINGMLAAKKSFVDKPEVHRIIEMYTAKPINKPAVPIYNQQNGMGLDQWGNKYKNLNGKWVPQSGNTPLWQQGNGGNNQKLW